MSVVEQVNVAMGATGVVPKAGIGGAGVQIGISEHVRKRVLLYVHWVCLGARTIIQSGGQTGLLARVRPTGAIISEQDKRQTEQSGCTLAYQTGISAGVKNNAIIEMRQGVSFYQSMALVVNV